jgi:hypothetical protein
MTSRHFIIAAALAASTMAMAPAMATPQPQEGRVAVGPVGSGPYDREWKSIQEATTICRQLGKCWVTDGIQIGPGHHNWIPNKYLTGAPVKDVKGNGLFEVNFTGLP